MLSSYFINFCCMIGILGVVLPIQVCAHSYDLPDIIKKEIKKDTEKTENIGRKPAFLVESRVYPYPVHETITKASFDLFKFNLFIERNITPTRFPSEKDLVFGVFWNDDPQRDLWESLKQKKTENWGVTCYKNKMPLDFILSCAI